MLHNQIPLQENFSVVKGKSSHRLTGLPAVDAMQMPQVHRIQPQGARCLQGQGCARSAVERARARGKCSVVHRVDLQRQRGQAHALRAQHRAHARAQQQYFCVTLQRCRGLPARMRKIFMSALLRPGGRATHR